MFLHHKKLMYTVRVERSDPALATLMLEQFGGPQGELAAAMRYFTQALGETDPGRKIFCLTLLPKRSATWRSLAPSSRC